MVGYRVCGDGDRYEDRDRDRLWCLSIRVRVRKRAIEPEEEESARARDSDVEYGDGASGIGVGTSVSHKWLEQDHGPVSPCRSVAVWRGREMGIGCVYGDWHPGMGMKLVGLGIGMRERKGSEGNSLGPGSAPTLARECRYPFPILEIGYSRRNLAVRLCCKKKPFCLCQKFGFCRCFHVNL